MRFLASFLADESGSTAIEYAAILLVCSVALIAALFSMRDSLSGMLGSATVALLGSP